MLRKLWNRLTREDTRHVWRALAVGGGGAYSTTRMTRAEAIEHVTLNGTHRLCWVDDVHRIIFYRYGN